MATDDPLYKKKRKALSSAFFKSKMEMITHTVKQTVLKTFYELQQKGDENEVVLEKFTSMVQSHLIMSILVGQEYSFRTLKHQNVVTGEVREITLGDFMDLIFKDVIARIAKNPLIITKIVTLETEMLPSDRRYVKNCLALRNFVAQIIDEKKASKLTDPSDFLALLLQDESYQEREDVIDDIIILFLAGAETVQGTTTNFITTMAHEPAAYKRLREEVDPFMQRVQDNIMEKMTLEGVEDLEYVKMCYQEVLRRDAPAAVSTMNSVTK